MDLRDHVSAIGGALKHWALPSSGLAAGGVLWQTGLYIPHVPSASMWAVIAADLRSCHFGPILGS